MSPELCRLMNVRTGFIGVTTDASYPARMLSWHNQQATAILCACGPMKPMRSELSSDCELLSLAISKAGDAMYLCYSRHNLVNSYRNMNARDVDVLLRCALCAGFVKSLSHLDSPDDCEGLNTEKGKSTQLRVFPLDSLSKLWVISCI